MDCFGNGRPSTLGLAVAMVLSTATAAPALAEDAGRNFEIYGFAQADFIQDFDGRLDPDWDDAFRPSKIGIDEQFGSDGQSSISVKQSRFGVKGSDADGRGRHAAQLQVRVRPVRHRRGCGPDDVPAAPRLRRVGRAAGGPDQQPVHGRRRVPEHDRLLGPGGHGVLPQRADPLDAVQDGKQPLLDRGRASGQRHRLGQPAPDRRLRGPAGAERRDAAGPHGAVPLRRRLGPRAGGGHPAQGRLRGARDRSADRWPSGSETGWGINVGSVDQHASAATRSCCRSCTAKASPAT